MLLCCCSYADNGHAVKFMRICNLYNSSVLKLLDVHYNVSLSSSPSMAYLLSVTSSRAYNCRNSSSDLAMAVLTATSCTLVGGCMHASKAHMHAQQLPAACSSCYLTAERVR